MWTVWIGGSFVTTKTQPGDVDVVWEIEGVDPEMLQEAWHGTGGLPFLKWMFAGDFFPTCLVEDSTGDRFVEFFQTNRDGKPVGNIRVDLSTL